MNGQWYGAHQDFETSGGHAGLIRTPRNIALPEDRLQVPGSSTWPVLPIHGSGP